MTRTPLVIVGAGMMGEVLAEYFRASPVYEIVAFAATGEYLTAPEFQGRPFVDFAKIADGPYAPSKAKMFVATGYSRMNRTRARFYYQAKKMGYELVTYVHPGVHIWPSTTLGDNVFIFEDNTVQPFTRIGSNTILWSGNHIGHHSKIGDHCFISSHVVISGKCEVGDYTFIGVNSTLRDSISVGRGCFLGAGTLLAKPAPDNTLFGPEATEPARIPASRFFKVPPEPDESERS
jgi:sugar O-acyltransferase (sialic acid O-acetyltransferase NeuD family)